MEFLQANAGNIVVGIIVFTALAAIVVRLVLNFRKGKTGCGCGCSGCTNSR